MNWQGFQTYGESPQNAFEAFTSMLFERWLKTRESGPPLNVVFVNGAGGDGGVEAYALISATEVIGMQAKWFPNTMQDKQFGQIRESIETALRIRPSITEYVVCVPRNLANRRKKVRENTEQQRWDSLVSDFKKSHQKLTLTLWNEARLEGLLIEHGSDGLRRYWFDRAAIRQNELSTRYNQAKSGWLAKRYLPDLHAAGTIESDLDERLAGSDLTSAAAEQSRVVAALDYAEREIRRLDSYPSFTEQQNSRQVVKKALSSLADARVSLSALQAFLTSNSFCVQLPNDADPIEALQSVAALFPSSKSMGIDRFERARKAINGAVEAWAHRQYTPHQQRELRQPVVFFAEPGAGKTHAFSSAVERLIDDESPAILVRAGKYAGSDSIEDILRDAVGEPDWSQTDVLDALDATALLRQAKAASALPAGVPVPRVRVLVAIDGLDESKDANDWSATVRSVVPLAKGWPRIVFAFSARPSLSLDLGHHSDISMRFIGESDVRLAPLYFAYTKENHVECPPSFRWALRSPLAIRLFADLYRGKTLTQWFDLSVAKLLDKKLDHVEEHVRVKYRKCVSRSS